jgi:hypothetical protein
MAKRRRRAGASAGLLAAIGMAAVGAVVALITGLGGSIGNASVAPDTQVVTHTVAAGAQAGRLLG